MPVPAFYDKNATVVETVHAYAYYKKDGTLKVPAHNPIAFAISRLSHEYGLSKLHFYPVAVDTGLGNGYQAINICIADHEVRYLREPPARDTQTEVMKGYTQVAAAHKQLVEDQRAQGYELLHVCTGHTQKTDQWGRLIISNGTHPNEALITLYQLSGVRRKICHAYAGRGVNRQDARYGRHVLIFAPRAVVERVQADIATNPESYPAAFLGRTAPAAKHPSGTTIASAYTPDPDIE